MNFVIFAQHVHYTFITSFLSFTFFNNFQMISREVSDTSKTTFSKNSNGIKYDTSSRFAESRVVTSFASTLNRASSLKSGYNGTPIIETMYNFAEKFPQLKHIEPYILAEQIVVDARTLPSNSSIDSLVADYYTHQLHINLNNIYVNAPSFFTTHFIEDPIGFELYQKYFYLVCFIKFLSDRFNDEKFQSTYKLTEINKWVVSRRDPNIDYIIVGPTENTIFDIKYEEHYNALISSSTSMADIVRYQQLTNAQTLSNDVLSILTFLQQNPNVYHKNPDEAKKYTLNINTNRDVVVMKDEFNNLLFDCGFVSFGDVTDMYNEARYDQIEVNSSNPLSSTRITSKKIERIFQQYSRIKILECIVAPDTFITSLDIFPKVFVVFQGVICDERNVYNTVENNYLKIGGSFHRTSRGYEFKQDVDAITYKSSKTRVNEFKIYISTEPGVMNQITPNEFPIMFSKYSIYQHPIAVNEQLNIKQNDIVRLSGNNVVDRDWPLFNGLLTKVSSSNEYLTSIDAARGTIDGMYYTIYNGMFTFSDISGKRLTEPDLRYIYHIEYETNSNILQLFKEGGIVLNANNVVDKSKESNIATKFVDGELITKIDGTKGQIEGRYFRILDGKFMFTDNRNNVYTSPDLQFVHNADIKEYNKTLYYMLTKSIRLNAKNINPRDLDLFKKVLSLKNSEGAYIAHIDYSNGTIENKYFRFIDGKYEFTDKNGNMYTTSDSKYVMCDDRANDLCLINLLNYSNEIYPINECSFLYSETLRTIQNMKYTMYTTNLTSFNFQYDSVYNILFGDNVERIYPCDIDDDKLLNWNNVINYDQYSNVICNKHGDNHDDKNVSKPKLISELRNVCYYSITLSINNIEDNTKYYEVNNDMETAFCYNGNEEDIPLIAINNVTKSITSHFADMGKKYTMSYTISENGKTCRYDVKRLYPKYGRDCVRAYYKYYPIIDQYYKTSELFTIKCVVENGVGTIDVTDVVGNTYEYTFTKASFNFKVSNVLEFDDKFTKKTMEIRDINNNQIIVKYCKYSLDSKTNVWIVWINKKGSLLTSSSANTTEIIVFDLTTANVYFGDTGMMTLKRDTVEEIGVDVNISTTIDNATFTVDGSVAPLIVSNKVATPEKSKIISGLLSLINMSSLNSNELTSKCFKNDKLTLQPRFSNYVDEQRSNAYKAFNISDIDVKAMHWEKDAFINGMLHIHLPIITPFYNLPTSRLAFKGNNDDLIIYTRTNEGKMNIIENEVVINDSGVYVVEHDIYKKYGGSLFISQSGIMSYYYEMVQKVANVGFNEIKEQIEGVGGNGENGVVSSSNDKNNVYSFVLNSSFNIKLHDRDDKVKYEMIIATDNTHIVQIVVCEIYQKWDKDGNIFTTRIPLDEYKGVIMTNEPIYVNDFEIVLNYKIDNIDNIITIYSATLNKLMNTTYEYKVVNGYVHRRIIHTFRYSNKFDRISTKDIIPVNIVGKTYSRYPYVKYIENSFMMPKRVDKSGRYLTIVKKSNTNSTANIVKLYNNYNMDKTNIDTMKIGNRIGTDNDYLIESMDSNMLIIGNVSKTGSIGDIAIRSDTVYAVPNEGKMSITLEFT